MTVKKNQGFTLVELLVVIAIIAILAAALFPAISGAIDSARATAVKNRGRGIWVAIMSANSEREQHDQPALWPGDLHDSGNSTVKDNVSAEVYFTYLMSDGITGGAISPKSDDSLVSDLRPSMLSAPGVNTLPSNQYSGGLDSAASATRAYNAWHVTVIRDQDPAEMPLFITRNVKTDDIKYLDSSANIDVDSTDPVALDDTNRIKPFGEKRAVWVNKGGGSFDARKLLMRTGRVCPVPKTSQTGDDTIKFLKSKGGTGS